MNKKISLELSVEKEFIAKIDARGQILIPKEARKMLNMKEGVSYLLSYAESKSGDRSYDGIKGIFLYAVNISYTPRKT